MMDNHQKEALMIKKAIGIICSALFLLILSAGAMATVNVSIGVNVPPPPPPLYVSAPPDMYVIPGTYAYFPPAVDVDIVFFGGYWYRPYQGYWYRSSSYNGKWVYIENDRLPRHIRTLPPDWRRVPPGHRHIPYGQMKKHWRTWERDKHWDKHQWKHEAREDHGGSKGHHKKNHGHKHNKHND
jgi:hypothetical protein